MKAFDKFGDVLNKKFSVKDRDAIISGLDSLKWESINKNLRGFSRAFVLTGTFMDAYSVFAVELPHAIVTGQWRSFFVKLETLAVARGATALTAYAFSIMLAAPLGILGYALILAIVSALIDDENVENVNELLGL